MRDDGAVVEALGQPRASFAGHTLETPWSTLQLAYFVGTAMWTYLTQPFTFAMPGFRTSELEPWDEAGQRWRRLRVAWPSNLATHSTEQTLYFDKNGLLARHDYDVEITGGTSAAHYVSDYDEVAGIKVPTNTGSSLALPTVGRSPSPSLSRSISAKSRSHHGMRPLTQPGACREVCEDDRAPCARRHHLKAPAQTASPCHPTSRDAATGMPYLNHLPRQTDVFVVIPIRQWDEKPR